ncbi:MAG: biotin/lipoyl-containing protein [Bacillota bacterium]
MKKFLIKVNGNEYEVEVEEILEGTSYVSENAATPAPVSAPAKQAPSASMAQPEKAAKPASNGKTGSIKITAPMPGTILKVVANVGDSLKRGDVVLVLEAMKMENEIVAPSDGVVVSINVDRGASVNAGDLLASLD